jgi:serine/threonine protein kinase
LHGRYVIGDALGSGGFAIVWRATDKQLGRDVAIKRLLHLERNQRERLIEEARATVKLGGHQNIVQVYDVIQEGDEALLVMEYVDGESLERICQRHIREGSWLEHEDAIDYFKQVLQGLVYAHQQGLSHRDIKPSNILVSSFGVVKLVDFGLAKTIEELKKQATVERGLAWSGTPNFMSPEQANGESMDQQSDVFSAGIVGYILLCGRHPFNHPSAVASVFELIKEPAFACSPPSGLTGRPASEQTSEVLVKMLRKNKVDRYKSALEALTDLTREPIQACSSCGAANSLSSRFCGQCGQLLKPSKPSETTNQNLGDDGDESVSAEELTAEGFRLTQEGNWEEAIRRYREATKRDSQYGLAYTNLGYALNRVGQYSEAIKALTKAVELTPQDVHLCRIYDLRAFSKMNLKDYSGAIADFTTALSHSTDDPRIFLHRAQARAQIGELSRSLQDVNRVLRLDPDNYQAIRLKRKLETEGAI